MSLYRHSQLAMGQKTGTAKPNRNRTEILEITKTKNEPKHSNTPEWFLYF